MTRCRAALATLVTAAALATAAVPAAGATSAGHVAIDGVRQSGSVVHVTLAVRGFETSSLPADAITATIAGKPVAVTADSATGAPARPTPRRALLLIDTSGSMAGTRIASARAAADAFLSAVQPDVQVGLAAVASTTVVLVQPTIDHVAVHRALKQLRPAGDTRLYDGVVTGLHTLGTDGDRLLVILSDGADTGSRTHLGATLRSVQSSHAVVDAIGLQTTASQARVLAALATAGGGRVQHAADGAALADEFRTTTHELASRIEVSLPVPSAAVGQNATLAVTVRVDGSALTDSRLVAFDASTVSRATLPSQRPSPTASSAGRNGKALALGFVAIFAAICLVIVAMLGDGSSAQQARGLVARYTTRVPSAAKDNDDSSLGSTGLMRSALALSQRLVDKPGRAEKLALMLERAGVQLRPNEWLVIRGISTLMTAVVLAFFGKSLLVGLLVGAPIGFVLPKAWLNRKTRKRRTAFVDRLPDSLQLVAGSLSAGYSLLQAFDGLVQEGEEPVAGEVGRALASARLGIPIEDALDQVAERVDSPDFAWTAMAIRIQREVGGNLGEVLTTVGETLRERAALRRQVRALSAEGRLSAYILIAIPTLMALFEVTFRRQYASVLWTNPIGIVLIVMTAILMTVGTVWMRKLVNVEV